MVQDSSYDLSGKIPIPRAVPVDESATLVKAERLTSLDAYRGAIMLLGLNSGDSLLISVWN